jgi:hypothetical protein
MSFVQRASKSENEEKVKGLSLSDQPEVNRKCGSESRNPRIKYEK